MPRLSALLLALALFAPLPAKAALFCVEVAGFPPQCLYDDAADCRREATGRSGSCSVNPDEVTLPASYEKFCLVTSSRIVQCLYGDYATCDREARRRNDAACVMNKARPLLGPSIPAQEKETYP